MNKKLISLFLVLSLAFITCVEEHLLPNFGHVFINTDPVGAAIFKDGINTGEITPANFDELLSGEHTFSLKMDSFLDTTFTIQVDEGKELSQNIFLTEENPLGKIILSSVPSGAVIYRDSVITGNVTPDTLENLQRGEYVFTLKLDLYQDSSFHISLDKDKTVERNTKLVIADMAGRLFITSDPLGAAIKLDGESTGLVTPDTLNPLSPGEHSILLSLVNYRDTTFTMQINEGQEHSQDIFLFQQNPLGKIILNSDPFGAEIYLDGISTGRQTPATFSNLQRGEYNFTLKLNLYEDHNVPVLLNQDETVEKNTIMIITGIAGSIYITSNPNGAAIELDGEQTGLVTPDTLNPLSPGMHSILLSLKDYRDTTIVSNVSSGEITFEEVDLTFYEPRGSITLDSNPQGALITLDGNNTGLFTPSKIRKLKAGEYSVKLSLDNYYDSTFPVTVTEDQNTTVPTVNMTEIPFMITLSSNPSEGGSTNGEGGYNHGEEVTVQAMPNTGYDFINWTENGNEVSNNSTYSFSAERDRTLIANFLLKSYTISATSKPAGSSTITGTGPYKHFDEVTLTTEPNPGYQFVNWTESGTEVSTSLVYTFTVNGDRELVANYVEIGNLKVNSDPEGADIYFGDEFTGEQTPHTFEDLLAGQYIVTLKLDDFADTSLTVLVNRNQLTDLGAIFLQDIVPAVEVTLNYRVGNNGQLIFLFSFNQDVKLNKVDFTAPEPDGTTRTQLYHGQSYPEGFVIELPYPLKEDGTWNFNFFGNKKGGRQAPFIVTENLLVN